MSYTSTLQETLQAFDTNNNSWGTVANSNFSILDVAINGYLQVGVASADVTLSFPPGTTTSNQAINSMFQFNGNLTTSRNVFFPATTRKFLVWNDTTGANTLTIAVVGTPGLTVTVPQGAAWWLACDGTNVFNPSGLLAVHGDPLNSMLDDGTIIKSGSLSMPNTGGPVAVTFATPFSALCVPIVQLTVTGGTVAASTSAPFTGLPTYTGFNAFWQSGQPTTTLHWHAIGY